MKVFLIKPFVLAIAAGVLSTAMGGGCGGSDDGYTVQADTTVTTASFPEAQLVPRINRICRRAWPTIFENFDVYSAWQDRDQGTRRRFADALRESLLAGITFHIFDSIYNMGAPAGKEAEVEEIIGAMQSANERGQKGLEPLSSTAQVEELYGEYNRLAREYGLGECLVDETRLKPIDM